MEGERERERGNIHETTVALQQCDPAIRCPEIPIGCQIAIRLVAPPRTIIARARIEPDRVKKKKNVRVLSSNISPFEWPVRSEFRR